MNPNIIQIEEQDSLNFHTNTETFSIVIAKLQALHIYLNNNPSSQCKDNYLTIMAYLIERYLDTQKQSYLCDYLVKMIVTQIEDKGAIKYFQTRFTNAKILDLLQYHYNLTGKRLFLTCINYKNQKFKVKVV